MHYYATGFCSRKDVPVEVATLHISKGFQCCCSTLQHRILFVGL